MYRGHRSYKKAIGKVFEACMVAAKNNAWDIEHYDENDRHIIAKAKMSLLSWGERIEINVIEDENEATVQFTSASLAQIVSWGKNESNFRKFFEELENILGG